MDKLLFFTFKLFLYLASDAEVRKALLQLAEQAAKSTSTTLDDKLVEGLKELT